MSKRVIKNVNEVVKILKLDNPILIGGYALEYYKIRKGNDYDFIVSKADHERLIKEYGEPNDLGNVNIDLKGKHGDVDNFLQIYYFDYDKLYTDALQEKHFMVTSLNDMYIMKSLHYIDDSSNKLQRDLKLILLRLYKDTISWKDEFNMY
jgi:hypothetical protein